MNFATCVVRKFASLSSFNPISIVMYNNLPRLSAKTRAAFKLGSVKASGMSDNQMLHERMTSCLLSSEENGCLSNSPPGHPLLIPGSKGQGPYWLGNTTRSSTMSSSGIRPLVICGPSGSGKSTLLKHLLGEFPDLFGFSVSHTTRKARPGEVNGKDYYFVDRKEMEQGIQRGDFIEYAEFSGNLYGTSKKAIRNVQDQGRICILDIEMEGVKKIKKTNLNPYFVFIKPPNMNVLEQRLRGRGTDSEESIRKRLAKAHEEMKFGETEGNFHLILVNEDVKETYKNLRNFLLKDLEEMLKKTSS